MTNTAETLARAVDTGRAHLAQIVELFEAYENASVRDDWNRADEIRDQAEAMPLSVQVRSGWFNPWDGINLPDDLEECRILLSTGGPACQVWAEINGYGEACLVRLQVQDWFEPWTDLIISNEEYAALEWFVQVFNLEGLCQ